VEDRKAMERRREGGREKGKERESEETVRDSEGEWGGEREG
jgi:hypothetical protein